MQRRVFLGACGAALAGGIPLGLQAQGSTEGGLLLALAEVVVPDRDPLAWRPGPAVDRLLAGWDSLQPAGRERLTRALSVLDQAAVKKGAAGFAGLDKAGRTALVGERLKTKGEFSESFVALRTLIIRAFYDSPLGFARTGYRPTTQFAGYPEYTGSAGNRE